jgi:DNA polymerase-1
MGIGKLAYTMKVPMAEAQHIKDEYYERFPAILRYIKQCDAELRRKGYVEDYFGRQYHLPDGQGYKAVNALVQGGCAQAFKIALLNIKQNGILSDMTRIILPVHDEVQIKRHKSPSQLDTSFVVLIRSCMEDIPQFLSRGLRLRVDVAYSDTNWAEKKEWKPEKK